MLNKNILIIVLCSIFSIFLVSCFMPKQGLFLENDEFAMHQRLGTQNSFTGGIHNVFVSAYRDMRGKALGDMIIRIGYNTGVGNQAYHLEIKTGQKKEPFILKSDYQKTIICQPVGGCVRQAEWTLSQDIVNEIIKSKSIIVRFVGEVYNLEIMESSFNVSIADAWRIVASGNIKEAKKYLE